MSKEVVVNTHIEKTAGTSLSAWFMKVYGSDRVLIYSPATDTLLRGTEVPTQNQLVDRVKSLIALTPFITIAADASRNYKSSPERKHIDLDHLPGDIDVVHGHFEATRFNGSLGDPFMSIVLRDPLERTISHYIFWKRRQGKTNQRINIPFDTEITFMDFAMLPQMINFQTQAIGGMSIEDFDLVGTTENMDTFTAEYFRRRGLEGVPPKLPDLNRTLMLPGQEKLGISEQFLRQFRQHNASDYENYARALELQP